MLGSIHVFTCWILVGSSALTIAQEPEPKPHMPASPASIEGCRNLPEAGRIFTEFKVEGTFVLFEPESASCLEFDSLRAAQRFLPASTFKIFNSMVALDEQVIPDETTVLPWDGVDRGWEAWNRDQDMRSAFRNSTVWFYQELARRTGADRMQHWLDHEGYGNADMRGGLDQFWLTGRLGISAREQILFLSSLYRRTLGFSRRAQDITWDLLLWEKTDQYTLRGKTGWTEVDGKQLGWIVGFLEANGRLYIYAMNFETPDPNFPMRQSREEMLRRILFESGIAPKALVQGVR